MRATQDLIAEHEAVLLALDLLARVEDALGAGRADAPQHLQELLDFLTGFVDLCHHGKEEDVLFPELERRGVPREGGPIGVMLAEHEAGRGHVRAMADGLARLRAGEPSAVDAIRQHAAAYRALLRSHIGKENGVLFPMADRLVPHDAAETMFERFEEIERDRVGAGRHEAFHAMLHRLREHYGLS